MSKSNNTIKEAVLDAQKLKETIKEESKSTLKDMLSEAVKDVIRESIEDDEEDKVDDDYEVVDDEKETQTDDEVSADGEETTEEPESTDSDDTESEEEEETEETPETDEDEWDTFSDYQVGDDNTYDLTDVQDYDKLVKVYKLLDDDDRVVVKKDGDKISLKDNESGSEFIIDLGTDGDETVEGGEEESMTEGVIKEGPEDIAGIPSNEDEDDELVPDDFELSDFDETPNNEPIGEGKKTKKVMKESKGMIFEVDLGYTDDYQDKDPIKGLSNTEPSKSGKSWEKGVPTGTEKPWAGDSKSKGEPFEKTVTEEQVDECGATSPTEEPIVDEGVTVAKAPKRRSPKTKSPNSGDVNAPKVSRHISVGSDYKEIAEAYKKENNMLRKAVSDLRNTVKEAYVANNNLARITRLFTENTVSQQEKIEIVERFSNEAKTIEQSNKLYETLDKQLKKNSNLTLESSKSMNVEGSKTVNEGKTNYQSKQLLNTIDLIKRMENC